MRECHYGPVSARKVNWRVNLVTRRQRRRRPDAKHPRSQYSRRGSNPRVRINFGRATTICRRKKLMHLSTNAGSRAPGNRPVSRPIARSPIYTLVKKQHCNGILKSSKIRRRFCHVRLLPTSDFNARAHSYVATVLKSGPTTMICAVGNSLRTARSSIHKPSPPGKNAVRSIGSGTATTPVGYGWTVECISTQSSVAMLSALVALIACNLNSRQVGCSWTPAAYRSLPWRVVGCILANIMRTEDSA